MDCTVIRPTDVYGPGSRPWVILPLETMKAGRFLLPAHGKGIFSPVYIDELVSPDKNFLSRNPNCMDL